MYLSSDNWYNGIWDIFSKWTQLLIVNCFFYVTLNYKKVSTKTFLLAFCFKSLLRLWWDNFSAAISFTNFNLFTYRRYTVTIKAFFIEIYFLNYLNYFLFDFKPWNLTIVCLSTKTILLPYPLIYACDLIDLSR